MAPSAVAPEVRGGGIYLLGKCTDRVPRLLRKQTQGVVLPYVALFSFTYYGMNSKILVSTPMMEPRDVMAVCEVKTDM